MEGYPCGVLDRAITQKVGRSNHQFSLLRVIGENFAVQSAYPLYPQKQTCALQRGMSALGQKRTFAIDGIPNCACH